MKVRSEWHIGNTIVVIIITVLSFIIIHSFGFFSPEFIRFWDNKINDQIYNQRSKNQKISSMIVHVDLNDTSIALHNISMYDRLVYANTVKALNNFKAKSILFDINFQETFNNNADLIFTENSKNHGNVYLPVIPQSKSFSDVNKIVALDNELESTIIKGLWHPNIIKQGKPIEAFRIISNFKNLQKTSKSTTHIAVNPDDDGIFRRAPMLIKYSDGYIPLIALKIICDYLEVDDKNVDVSFGNYIKLKNPKTPYGQIPDIKIPIDINGNMIINFAGKWEDTFFHYQIEHILEMVNDKEKFSDYVDNFTNSLVIIADNSTRGKDFGNTPIEKVFPLSGIYSNIMNSILMNKFIKPLPTLFLVIFNIFLIFLFILSGSSLKTTKFTIFALAIFVLTQALNIFLFLSFNVQTTLLTTSLSIIFSGIGIIIYRFITEERNHLQYVISLHQAASKFVPTEFLMFLERLNILDVKLGDQIQTEMTVLFSDIRSFTTISENMTPEENFNFLNSYLNLMGPVIRENQGFIDKYIGDAIMALFPKKPKDCVESAISMREKLKFFNKEREQKELEPIDIGIGIHTGTLMLGIIGEEKRFEGTVIADAVNLASRLEGLTKKYGAGIIISEAVYKKLPNREYFTIRFLDMVKVKGKNEPISIFEVLNSLDEKQFELKKESIPEMVNAFDYYRNKSFNEALTIYEKIITKNPSDKTANIFINRIENHLKYGVNSDWDGIEKLYEK